MPQRGVVNDVLSLFELRAVALVGLELLQVTIMSDHDQPLQTSLQSRGPHLMLFPGSHLFSELVNRRPVHLGLALRLIQRTGHGLCRPTVATPLQ